MSHLTSTISSGCLSLYGYMKKCIKPPRIHDCNRVMKLSSCVIFILCPYLTLIRGPRSWCFQKMVYRVSTTAVCPSPATSKLFLIPRRRAGTPARSQTNTATLRCRVSLGTRPTCRAHVFTCPGRYTFTFANFSNVFHLKSGLLLGS